MKITSDGYLALKWWDIDMLHLKLDSTDAKMRLVTKPLRYGAPTNPISVEDDTITIEFTDSYELDIFIEALTKFRNINRSAMGEWRVTLDDVRGGFQ